MWQNQLKKWISVKNFGGQSIQNLVLIDRGDDGDMGMNKKPNYYIMMCK